MKILILSDSHYVDISGFDYNSYNYIFHAGDYGNSRNILEENRIIYVKGNCDLYGDKDRLLDIYGKNVYLVHGDFYNVKNDLLRLTLKAKSINANYVIYGHTHIPAYYEIDGIVFINPGSFQDGYYVVLDEEKIDFYYFNTLKKSMKRKW